jgi:hypothetical protein
LPVLDRARVRGARERASRPGQLGQLGHKGGCGPNTKRKCFFFTFSNKQPQNFLFEQENSFSQVDPKTKVVQNFILYNIALGYILKFQIDFEIGI